MLYLTRQIGASVIINDNIEVTVVDIRGKSIKLGSTFPSDSTILAREDVERTQEAKHHPDATYAQPRQEGLGGTVRKLTHDTRLCTRSDNTKRENKSESTV